MMSSKFEAEIFNSVKLALEERKNPINLKKL